jgi:predicted nucleic acid-binding protein
VRFWDSSAVVPLLVQQRPSEQCQRWLTEDGDPILWTLTSVEVISALRRLCREGRIEEADAVEAESGLSTFAKRANVIADVERVKELATRLLRVHALTAADTLQLAAALTWTSGSAPAFVFHTLDDALALAARREGFTVP